MSTHVSINAGKVSGEIRRRAEAGVRSAANAIAARAVPLTPLGETGNLRQSIGTVGPTTTRGAVRAGVRSDGVIYARRQHEETTWRHPRGGQAKYLEAAKEQGAPDAARIIQNHIRGRF